MPELPEVETVRRGLAPCVEDRRILRAEARRADLRWPLPQDFAHRLAGRRIEAIGRRAKYLLWRLEGGETLIAHLGMSGRFLTITGECVQQPGRFAYGERAPRAGDGPHDHVILDLADETGAFETRIVFRDPRRFGAMDLSATRDLDSHPWLAGLGPEPFSDEFATDWLQARFRGRRAPVKSLLLDQRIIAGLGNIYVSEALHRAGIAPRRAAGRIGAGRVHLLHAAILEVLREAIQAGGSSLRDFQHTDGDLGYFQHHFAVYDRTGESCLRPGCGGVVRSAQLSGRSSFWCPKCQR